MENKYCRYTFLTYALKCSFLYGTIISIVDITIWENFILAGWYYWSKCTVRFSFPTEFEIMDRPRGDKSLSFSNGSNTVSTPRIYKQHCTQSKTRSTNVWVVEIAFIGISLLTYILDIVTGARSAYYIKQLHSHESSLFLFYFCFLLVERMWLFF